MRSRRGAVARRSAVGHQRTAGSDGSDRRARRPRRGHRGTDRRAAVRRLVTAPLAGSLVLGLSLAVLSSPPSPVAGAATYAPVGTFYVADAGAHQLVPVAATGTKGSAISLPTSPTPAAVALSADGATAWTANAAAGTLSKVDLQTGTASTIDLGAKSDPVAVAVDPFTTFIVPGTPTTALSTEVFVVEGGATGQVVGLDPTTGAVEATSGALSQPDGLGIATDGSGLYVTLADPAAKAQTAVEVLTPASLSTAYGITTGASASAIVTVQSTGSGKFFVASAATHKVSCIQIGNVCGPTYVFSLGTMSPVAIGRSLGGTRLVVAEKTAGKATVIDVTTTHLGHETTLTVPGADGVALSANGVVAVTGSTGTSFLSLTSWTAPSVTKVVTGFSAPAAVAAAPAVAPTASFTFTLAAPGSPTRFDAAASTPGTSPIASYTWTFGDETAQVTTSTPVVTHTYAIPLAASYTVKLRVTGTDGVSSTDLVTTGQSTVVDGGAQASQTQTVSGFLTPPGVVYSYVTDNGSGYLQVVDAQTLAGTHVVGTIPLQPNPAHCHALQRTDCGPTGTFPVGLTTSPTLAYVYVDVSGDGSPTLGAIDVVDVATNRVVNVIGTTSVPQSSAISPNGKTLYVVGPGGTGTTPPVLQAFTVSTTGRSPQRITLPSGQLPFDETNMVAVGDHGKRVVVALNRGEAGGVFEVYTVGTTGSITPTPTPVTFTGFAFAESVATNPKYTTVVYGTQGVTGTTNAVTVLTLLNLATPPVVDVRPGYAGPVTASNDGTTVAVAVSTLGSFAVRGSATGKARLETGAIPFTTTSSGPGTFVAPLTAPAGAPKSPSADTPVALPGAANPTGMGFRPTGTGLLVVENSGGTLTVLDSVTKVVATIPIGTDPLGVAFGMVTPPPPPPPPPSTPEFTVVKSDTPGSGKAVVPGAKIGYSVKVTNVGTASGSATITDPVPSNVTLSGTPACAATAAGNTCSVSVTGTTLTMKVSLAPGRSATMTFDALVKTTDRATVVNTATITTGPCSAPHCSSTVTNPVVVLEVVKGSTPEPGSVVAPLTKVTYTLTLTDLGTAATTPVTVTDQVPTGTAYVPGSATCGGAPGCTVAEATGTVTWGGIVVQPGAASSLVLSFQAMVSATDTNGQKITNVAVFSNDGTPGCTATTCTTNQVTLVVAVAAPPPAPPTPVQQATTAHTGEPFAGSLWIELLGLFGGLGLLAVGESLRRRRAPAVRGGRIGR